MSEALIRDGWDYHDTESERLAGELEAAEFGPALALEAVRLGLHTIGEHLGDWPRARRFAERTLAGRTPAPDTAIAWGWLSVARRMSGDFAGAEETEARAMAAATSPAALHVQGQLYLALVLATARRLDEAATPFKAALELARDAHTPEVCRALAVTGNNFASELLGQSRTPDGDALMALAAATSHTHWLECGDWINEERALWLRALVCNALGEPREALAFAAAGLAIIAAHTPRPLDGARLHLTRANAFAALGDADARTEALAAADAAAAPLTLPGLRAAYAAERSAIG